MDSESIFKRETTDCPTLSQQTPAVTETVHGRLPVRSLFEAATVSPRRWQCLTTSVPGSVSGSAGRVHLDAGSIEQMGRPFMSAVNYSCQNGERSATHTS